MPSAVVEALLEVAPIFANFTAADRNDIMEIAVEETFGPELEIVSCGDQANSILLLAEGTVEVIEASDFDDPETIATLIPPCTFGEVAFFEKSTHTVGVKTLTPVRIISIERAGYDRLLKRGSLAAYKLALNVLLKLGDQVRRVEHWVEEELNHSRAITHDQWNAFRSQLYQGWEV
jgi:CRP-like cAMP-binding protein